MSRPARAPGRAYLTSALGLLDTAHIVADRPCRGHAARDPAVEDSSGSVRRSSDHIAADYYLHVSKRLLAWKDGPMLEGLKRLIGRNIHLPGREKTVQIEVDPRYASRVSRRRGEMFRRSHVIQSPRTLVRFMSSLR